MAEMPWHSCEMRTREINTLALIRLRGKRSKALIAHELRKRGHGTDAKSIWRYENGHSQPNARILPDLADVLGAGSIDELFLDDEAEAASMSSAAADFTARLDALLMERAFVILDRAEKERVR